MRKSFPFYIFLYCFLVFVYGCTTSKTFRNTQNLLFKESSGFFYLAILVETNSNFSSLLYDKTAPDFDVTVTKLEKKIPANKKIYIVPPSLKGEYDEAIKTYLEKVITYNNIGTTVKNESEAEYIIIVKIEESVTRLIGTNSAEIIFDIVDNNYTPKAFASLKATSKSDSNFFYFQGKNARPVSYLKAKGLGHLIEKAFPKIFDIKKEKKDA